jgi:hypothetical protein
LTLSKEKKMKKHERRRELHDDEVYVEKIATLSYDEWSCE